MTLCFHCLAAHGGWQQDDLSVLPWEVELAFIYPDEAAFGRWRAQAGSLPNWINDEAEAFWALWGECVALLWLNLGNKKSSPCASRLRTEPIWRQGLNLRMCSLELEEIFGHCLFMSVELWGHNFACEATLVSCSIVRYEFEPGMVKIGFLLAGHCCNSCVCSIKMHIINYFTSFKYLSLDFA